jgi:hypothetical protein
MRGAIPPCHTERETGSGIEYKRIMLQRGGHLELCCRELDISNMLQGV